MRQGLNETTTFNQNTFDLKKTYNFGKVKLSIFVVKFASNIRKTE